MTFPLALWLSALSGVVALSSELLWYRAFSFASMGAASSFGAVLGFYLLGIAAGSFASGRLCRDRDAEALRPLVRAIALVVLGASVLGFFVIPALALAARHQQWSTPLPLLAVTTTLMGAVFPLVSHAGIAPDERAGARVSYIYVANIVGSAGGSLLTGFVLMDVWPLRWIATAVALGGLALAAGVFLLARPTRRQRGRGAAALVVAAAVVLGLGPGAYHHVYEKLQQRQRYDPTRPFAHIVETRSGVITVTDEGLVYGGGVYDGAFKVDLGHDRNGINRIFALAAMHAAPRQVLMVGLSSGSWARVVAALPGVQRLTIVEINPGYLDLIRLYPGGSGLLDNPKVRIVIDDGRRWLLRHPEARFDAIVQNTTWHWRAHASSLLSREYFALVRSHLASGGLLYVNTTFSDAVQKTATVAFPHTLRVAGFVAASDGPFAFDKARWRGVLETLRFEGRPLFNLQRPDDRALLEKVLALADTFAGPGSEESLERDAQLRARLQGTPIVTDDNMLTEW